MFGNLFKELTNKSNSLVNLVNRQLDKDAIAALLQTTPEALQAFEQEYEKVTQEHIPEDIFDMNAKQAAEQHEGIIPNDCPVQPIIDRIVKELLAITPTWCYDGKVVSTTEGTLFEAFDPVTNEEIKRLPETLRPQLTGHLVMKDIKEPAYLELIRTWQQMKQTSDPRFKRQLYGHFRQGLDMLDLDSVMYEMLGTNPNSMGYWLPRLIDTITTQTMFRVPKTTIFKVPLPMLQLSRLSYETLTRTTLDIVDQFVFQLCHLDENASYFIKTGTYSNKFDFRNVKITTPKEVRELGEYLVFIQHYASMMAGPLNNVSIYGVSTTNEYVVREFIEDAENNPTIYHGLPLHTEYRVFVDFDTKEILGINPYWDPKTMKERFDHAEDSNDPDKIHDSIIYRMHEPILMQRYEANKDHVLAEVQKLLNHQTQMHGQWSLDIMQNGTDFWFIDMALAANSALKECIPAGKLKPVAENWIPDLSNN